MVIPVRQVSLILLSENVANGTLKLGSGQTILLSGFGGGLTWGSLIVKI